MCIIVTQMNSFGALQAKEKEMAEVCMGCDELHLFNSYCCILGKGHAL